MIEHVVSEVTGDNEPQSMGMRAWIQPVCSCGWKGNKVHAYNNWQTTLVHDAKVRHLEAMRKKNLEVT